MSSPSTSSADNLLTLTYKYIGQVPVLLDVYLPETKIVSQDLQTAHIPAVIYFHGGGLTVGNRKSWFPHWLKDRVIDAGFLFICPDYRLIPPSSGHDLLEDIKDLFHFVVHGMNVALSTRKGAPRLQLNPDAIAVAGSSAGGLCAYLAAMHAHPTPKAVVSLYGMGGDFLTPHYLSEKRKVFFRGRELLEPEAFSQFIYPASLNLGAIIDSPLSYHPSTSPTPGYPANPRMQLARLYLQMGNFLDYYTGQHEPSLSANLQEVLISDNRAQSSGNDKPEDLLSLIPKSHRDLFPQFAIFDSWPPTLLVHGSEDSAVQVHESIHLHRLLQSAGVASTLRVVDSEEHSFDYAPDAHTKFGMKGGLFDDILDFLLKYL
ncbi:unnamed protein product [Somion occarium]|uniref:Alpha/beta hydrolase fold-3 domain-containing protein n=1 Tax=Somion occarium TaxID=3059160 RepID=A0ABP1E110_9APHY